MSTAHRSITLALGVVVTMALVGCTPTEDPTGDPPTTSTSSAAVTTEPSPTPTQQTAEELAAEAKKANIAAAKALVIEYYRVNNEVSNAGYADWEARLSPFWGSSEIIAADTAGATAFTTSGQRTTGQTKVEGLTVTDYKGDPASTTDAQQVYIEGCTDVSAVRLLNPDGTEVARDPALPLRFLRSWKVERIVGEWKIVTDTAHLDQPC